MFLIFLLVLLSGCRPLYAQEVVMNMDMFIDEEDKRIQEIRLLDLDVQKADLQLKQQEIARKMANSVGEDFTVPHPAGSNPAHASMRVISVVVADDYQEAVLKINEQHITCHQGDFIGDGWKVEAITREGVKLLSATAGQRSLMI